MRTIETKIFTFAELSEDVKQTVKDKYAELHGYERHDEAMDTLKAMAEHFDCKLADWEVDYFNTMHSSAKFVSKIHGETPAMDEVEIFAMIDALGSVDPETGKGSGECVLTGFFLDEDAADGIRQAWAEGVTDLNDLLQAGFESWLKAAQADCEDFYSDEQFAEMCEANEWEFYEDGRRYVAPKKCKKCKGTDHSRDDLPGWTPQCPKA